MNPSLAGTGILRPSRIRRRSAAFALLNGLRIVVSLPTLAAIRTSSHVDHHSLVTWLTFLGANLTMALSLHERNGLRMNRAITANTFSALMCGAIVSSIG
jgi:hypothetical protein